MSKYDLSYNTWGPEEVQAVQDVLDSGYFTMGKRVKEFEERFAEKFGMKYAVMTNSGSSANLISVAAFRYHSKYNIQPGDEVIVPCIAWATTYYPFMQYGAKLRFVDIDLKTMNYDMEKLRAAVTDKTKMIVAVSILGNPCRFDEISDICDKNGLILFEDNCESMGAKFNGRYSGTFGLMNTFSLFFSHHISTVEGGVVLTNDYESYCLLRSMRNHGWTRDQGDDSPLFEKTDDSFFEAYRFILPGYNVRPGEINAAAGLSQLDKFDDMMKIRIENAGYIKTRMKELKNFIIPEDQSESSWFSFPITIKKGSGIRRKEVLKSLRDKDIEFRIVTGGNFLRHDVIKYCDHTVHSRENADYVHDNSFFVGNYPADAKAGIDLLIETLKAFEV